MHTFVNWENGASCPWSILTLRCSCGRKTHNKNSMVKCPEYAGHCTQRSWVEIPWPPAASPGEGSFPKGGDSFRECPLDMARVSPNLSWLLQHQTCKQWEHGVSPDPTSSFPWAHGQNILQGCAKYTPVPPALLECPLRSSPSVILLSLHQWWEENVQNIHPLMVSLENLKPRNNLTSACDSVFYITGIQESSPSSSFSCSATRSLLLHDLWSSREQRLGFHRLWWPQHPVAPGIARHFTQCWSVYKTPTYFSKLPVVSVYEMPGLN